MKFKSALITIFILLGVIAPARAQFGQPEMIPVLEAGSSDWARTAQADVRLVSALSATGGADKVLIGLHYKLTPGWKIYWRAPGDAGYPPSITWDGSDNVKGAKFLWPAPQRFSVLGLQTVGYHDEVLLPLTVTLEDPSRGLRLKAAVDYLICSEICVPGAANLSLDIPPGPGTPTAFVHLIDQYKTTVPSDGKAHGLGLKEVVVETTDAGQILQVTAHSYIQDFEAPDVFFEGSNYLNVGPPEVELTDGGRTAILRSLVTEGTGPAGGLVGAPITLTLVDGVRGLEAQVAPTAYISSRPKSTGFGELAGILAIALLGGLILNLMPCVLPVLSLKLLSLVGHGGAERRHVRTAFIFSASGIIFSFLVLAAAAIGVKMLGVAVGWGIQFQQPLFLIAMVTLIILFAANMWGFFEINLPEFLNLGGMFDRKGGSDHSHSYGGHFTTGAFATLLATPCSAPFLGTAIGFGLSRGPVEIGLIFLFLGLGMSLPYLAVAAFPGLATRLPKPGAWMLRVKQIMGLALVATAIWLLTVLVATVGRDGALMVGGLMVGILGLLALSARVSWRFRALDKAAVAGFVVLAMLVPQVLDGKAPTAGPKQNGTVDWQPFSRNELTALLAEGKVVLVDVTADWCITCIVNKTTVLEASVVAKRLAAPNVVAMQADWTRPDQRIADYLASFDRYGIPFNAVYGPGAPKGILLSELLTNAEVLEALDKAAR